MQPQTNGAAVAGGALRVAALALAALLLGNQLLLAWHYTEGASFDVRFSALSVMVALALLPFAYELARLVGGWTLKAGVILIGLAFLAYALPATASRISEPREREATQAARYAAVQSEYAQAKIALGEAQGWLRSCRQRYQKCPADDARVERLTEQVNKLRDELNEQPGAAPNPFVALAGQVTGFDQANVRLAIVLVYALGVELGIALLVALGVRRRPLPEVLPVEPERTKPTKCSLSLNGVTWVAGYLADATEPVSAEDAYATYVDEWKRRGKRTMSEDKFTEILQKEAKRRGLVMRQVGRRRLYAVA